VQGLGTQTASDQTAGLTGLGALRLNGRRVGAGVVRGRTTILADGPRCVRLADLGPLLGHTPPVGRVPREAARTQRWVIAISKKKINYQLHYQFFISRRFDKTSYHYQEKII